MFVGGLLLGIALICLAGWLDGNERRVRKARDDDSQLDREYLDRRGRRRSSLHQLLLACGVLILVASLAGPRYPIFWITSWLAVSLALLSVIVLAAVDAVRTRRYHASKLSEIRRRTLPRD